MIVNENPPIKKSYNRYYLNTGQNTAENIQAITSVEVLIIPKNIIDELANQNSNWIKFLKILAEQRYIEHEKRTFQLQKHNAEQRFLNLLNKSPTFLQNQLANSLGITPQSLSGLRSSLIKEKI